MDLATKKTVTPRYLKGFECIGEACEEHCCGGWRITVDEAHYLKLKEAMDHSKSEREQFRSSLKRARGPEKSAQNYAVLQKQPDGNCSMLGSDRLCSIQKRYGESFLSDTCTTYPRASALVGERLEMAAMLSCPEVARRCLLDADALQLTELELPAARLLMFRLDDNSSDLYERYFDTIRVTILQLLSTPNYPIDLRLFLVLRFADRTKAFFHRGIETLDEAALATEIHQVSRPEAAQKWHNELQKIDVPPTIAMNILVRLIPRSKDPSSFNVMAQEIAARVAEEVSGDQSIPLAEREVALYYSRKQYWEGAQRERLDQYFSNYCRNYWLTEWYMKSRNLLEHMHQLLARIVVLRFLLFCHPNLRIPSGPDTDPDPGRQRALLDRTAVEIFYRFSRAHEHDPKLMADVLRALEELDMLSFAHAVFLLKF